MKPAVRSLVNKSQTLWVEGSERPATARFIYTPTDQAAVTPVSH